MIDYRDLFNNFREKLSADIDAKTPEITKRIKSFFADKFSQYVVLPGNGEKEFLVDVFVANCNPRQLGQREKPEGFRAILAVESELGGEGGGAQSYLKRNVFEDFAKLLVINSEFKIMIFTSLPYAGEQNHLQKWIKEMDSIYRDAGYPGNILLIHLQSEAQKTINNNPTNPKVSLRRDSFSGFVLSKGMECQPIA